MKDLTPQHSTASETFFNPGVKFPDTIFRRFFQLFTAFSPVIAEKHDILVILQDFPSPKPHLTTFQPCRIFLQQLDLGTNSF